MSSSKGSECVRVCVRCRPFSRQEIEDGRTCIVSVDPSRCEIQVRNPKQEEQPRMFTFDLVYPQDCLQEKIHQQAAHPIVQSVLEGYNGTIFAYGQTGTGKTYTMEGQQEPADKRGIIPRAFEQIFYGVEQSPGKQFLVRASFLEIYNEEIRDLLSKNPKNRLELKENVETGFYVKDLSSFVVKNIEEMREIMLSGISHRSTGETNMNERSSRSHCIFTITVEQSEVWQDGRQHYRVGKLNLVDLAGSERQSKTGSTGERLVEATKINQSLSTLGNVISALVDGKSTHIPYRDSKLTKLLMDSLGGNTKTVMMANIGPADFNYEETLSTLRYASRAKSIKNKPKINEDPKDALLREYQDEIARLRAQLELQQQGAFQGGPGMPGQVIEVEKIVQIEDTEKIQQMEAKIEKEKQQIIQESQKQIQEVLNQKNLAEEEKQKLIRKLKKQESKQTKAKEKQQKDLSKLKQFEEQLIRGQQIMEQAVRQEQELAYMQQTIAQQRQQEQQIAKQLAHKKEQNLVKQQQFSSEEQQLEAINEKISTC